MGPPQNTDILWGYAMQRLPLNGWEPIDPRGRKKKGE